MPFTIPSYDVWPIVIPDATDTTDGLMSAADKAKLDSLTPGGTGAVFLWTLAKTWSDISAEIVAAGGGGIVLMYGDPTSNPRQISGNPGDVRNFNDLYFIGIGESTPSNGAVQAEFNSGWRFSTLGTVQTSLRSKDIVWTAPEPLFDGGSVPIISIDLDGGGFNPVAGADTFVLVAGSSLLRMTRSCTIINGSGGAFSLFDLTLGATLNVIVLGNSDIIGLVARSSDASGAFILNSDESSSYDLSGENSNDILPLPGAPDYPLSTIQGQANGLTGPRFDIVSTVGAGPSDIGHTRLLDSPFNIAGGPTAVEVTARVAALNRGAAEGTSKLLGASYRVTAAGVITQIGAQTIIQNAADAGAAGWTAVLMTDGATIFVRVTGQGGKTIDWTISLEVPRFAV